jgi:hypothetical protein
MLCDATDDSLEGQIIPHGTWALTDSQTMFEKPCAPFLAACRAGNAWIVQTTSPSQDKWVSWREAQTAKTYWMDVFPLDELTALGQVLNSCHWHFYLHAELFM